MMESGPFSPVWDKLRKRLDELAKETAEDVRGWMEENQDVLTEQARYMRQVDLAGGHNATTQISVEFDFSGIRKDGPGYSISYADKHKVTINVPYVNFKPNDDNLDK